MAAIAQLGISWAEKAAKRFHTARWKCRGTGRFAVILCAGRVNLYPTAEERDAALARYNNSACGNVHCCFLHRQAEL